MNSIDDLVNVFKSIFDLLWSSHILGVPFLFWFILIGVFGIIGSFIQGRKDK